jgi:hypothetical protein
MVDRPPLPSFSPQPLGGQAYVALVLISAIALISAGLAPRAFVLVTSWVGL